MIFVSIASSIRIIVSKVTKFTINIIMVIMTVMEYPWGIHGVY